MKYLSLFSGIGGFELGIQQADIRQPSTCIGYSEIDKYAVQIYEKHFNHKNYGDITKIIPTELPDFDLLVGGFPCQSFSIAGKRGGFNDTRGTLFFDIARILADKKPTDILLENVKGLLSHEGGRTFQTIIGVLTDLGYFVEWQVLNSKNFGVPQNRERVFIRGHFGGQPRQKVFPIGGTDGENTKPKGIQSDANSKQISRTLLSRDYKDPKLVYDGMKIRRLTPTECERLQGFPDNWTKYGINEKGEQVETSDTQRYKTLGNAVTVNVIKEIINKFLKAPSKNK